MSLLYECINGIIQGGIFNSGDADGEEIATLCVMKLRGMILEGDANRKSRNSLGIKFRSMLTSLSEICCFAGIQ